MALSNGTEGGLNFVNLKLVSEVGPTTEGPKLVVIGADFKPTDENYTKVNGVLDKIKGSFTPAKGRMGDIYGFKAFIRDGNDIYVLESTITNASKGLLNALLNAKGKEIEINVYLNKNGYPSASVKSGGVFVEGVLPFNQLDGVALYKMIGEIYGNEGEGISVSDIPF